jgi:hypothetical protein
MNRAGLRFAVLATAVAAFSLTPIAGADDPVAAPEPPALTSATTDSGYEVTLTGPVTAVVGEPAVYTATCGGGFPCPYGEFRTFGGITNRLGEGFGLGDTGTETFRAPGLYSIRYRVGAACPGSPRRACPIDVWINTQVEAAADAPAADAVAPDPVAADPPAVDPAATDPAATDPAATDPPVADPPVADAPAADPAAGV